MTRTEKSTGFEKSSLNYNEIHSYYVHTYVIYTNWLDFVGFIESKLTLLCITLIIRQTYFKNHVVLTKWYRKGPVA